MSCGEVGAALEVPGVRLAQRLPRRLAAGTSRCASGLQRELLEGVAALADMPAAHGERPRYLAHVDGPARVHRQAMRRREAAGRARVGAAPPGEDATILVIDADPAVPRVLDGPVALRSLALVPPQLRDIGSALRVEDEVGWPLGVGPLAEVLAVRAEDLDAVVLAVADEDAPVRGDGDAVRQVELAGAGARDTPGLLQLATR